MPSEETKQMSSLLHHEYANINIQDQIVIESRMGRMLVDQAELIPARRHTGLNDHAQIRNLCGSASI